MMIVRLYLFLFCACWFILGIPLEAGTSTSRSLKKSAVKEKRTSLKINSSRRPLAPPPGSGSEDVVLAAEPAYLDMDLPTDNQLIFSKTTPSGFFQPTFSGRTVSAMFGCVRNPGAGGIFTRFHEGVDIRPLERNRKGEPTDEIRSAGAGKVAYVCREAAGSNYGKYVVIEHGGLFSVPLYTLYAHLSSVRADLEIEQSIAKGERLGTLGRTSSEFDIEQDRAHLHFEVDMMGSSRFVEWSRHAGEGTPRHGLFNGANLVGIDPVRFFQFLQINSDLGVGDFVKRERVAFRVLVPANKKFSWIAQYPFALTKPMTGQTEFFDISMTYYGLPIRVIPRTAAEIPEGPARALKKGLFPLIYANAPELNAHAACRLINRKGRFYGLSARGYAWLKQILY